MSARWHGLYAGLALRAVVSRLREARPAVLLLVAVTLTGLLFAAAPPAWDAGVNIDHASASPSADHPLGADHLGRDVALRTLGGAAAWLLPALLAALVSLTFGTALGLLLASPLRPLARAARLVEAVAGAVPALVLAVLAASITGGGLPVIGGVLGLGAGLGVAAGVAERYRELQHRGYLDAHRAHGTPLLRRLLAHTVIGHAPDVLARGVVDAVATVLVAEATLSYLGGFGTPEPTPSWGNMMAFEWVGSQRLALGWVAPLGALLVTVTALDQVGRSLTGHPATSGTRRPQVRATVTQEDGALRAEEICVTAAGRTLLEASALRLAAGELVAVVGPSGAGKTQLLHAIAAQGPTATALVRQHAGRTLDPLQRVRILLQRAGADDPARFLRAVGLADEARVLEAWPHELSGGMATRVALARELARGARWLLVDEPLSGLDPLAAVPVLQTLRGLADGGAGVLWTTHHLSLAARHADRVIVVQAGRISATLERPFPADLAPLLRPEEAP